MPRICVQTHLAPLRYTKDFFMAQAAYKTFLLNSDLLQKLDKLTLEQKGKLLQAILEFENGIAPVFDDLRVEYAFDFIRPDLEQNNKKYAATVERNRQNGAKGGRPRLDKNPENPKNPVGFAKPTKPTESEITQETQTAPQNLDIDIGFDNKNITAGAAAEFLTGKFGVRRPKGSPTLQWQVDALRLAEQFKLDLDGEFTRKKGGKSYKIADSWYKLFRDGGGQVAGRLEAAYSYFADQPRFFGLSDDVKWGYLRDIAHNGLEQFKQKGVIIQT